MIITSEVHVGNMEGRTSRRARAPTGHDQPRRNFITEPTPKESLHNVVPPRRRPDRALACGSHSPAVRTNVGDI